MNTASGVAFFKCGECPRVVLLRAQSTDHLRKHLVHKHRVGPEGRLPSITPFSIASNAANSAAVDMAVSLITRVALYVQETFVDMDDCETHRFHPGRE